MVPRYAYLTRRPCRLDEVGGESSTVSRSIIGAFESALPARPPGVCRILIRKFARLAGGWDDRMRSGASTGRLLALGQRVPHEPRRIDRMSSLHLSRSAASSAPAPQSIQR